MGPVSQQSHLLLMGSEGLFWHRRIACAQGPYWNRVVLFLGLPCRRHRSDGRDGVSPAHASGPNALVDGRRVEQEVHSRRQVFRYARARARACALLGRGGCRRCVAEISAVAQGVWLAVQVAANLDRQWWMLCSALRCSGSGYRRGSDTGQ